MSYIGNTATTQAFTPAVDYFSGNGSTTAFTLSRPVASVAQVEAVIDNVVQNPSSAYTVSGNTITFTSAPLSGTNNIYVRYTSPITQVIAPGQGTVNTTALGNITNIASGNSSLTLQTGSSNTTAVTVDTSQNVGIGTSSPAAKLELGSGTLLLSNNVFIQQKDSSGNAKNVAGVNSSNQYNFGGLDGSSTVNTIRALVAGNEAMRIDSSGNVGIGTTSTSAKLSVSLGGVSTLGQQSNQALALLGGGSNNQLCQIGMGYGTGATYTPTAIGSITTTQTGNTIADLIFATRSVNTDTAPTERMRIDSSGSLMIGTTSPGGRLTVAGVDSSGSNNALYVKNSNSNALFYVRDDGWLNLGNASVSPYNNTTGNGANMYIATDSSVQRSTSSLKYKTDVVDARFGLADVLKLRAVNYKSKNPSDGDKVFGGLIAEEVEEAGLTEFVIHAEDGTPDALNYSNMVSLAFKAIQELKALVDAQATEIAELKAKVGV